MVDGIVEVHQPAMKDGCARDQFRLNHTMLCPSWTKRFSLLLIFAIGSVVVLHRLDDRSPTTTTIDLPHPLNTTQSRTLQILIPATRTNVHLCQLFITAAILDYPAPILINWQDPEDDDQYVQHLAKVRGVLQYLDSLPSAQDNDLILMVDGYDSWFQLSPDVVIDRYYSVVADLQHQNVVQFGNDFVERHAIADSVIFGADKLCWPNAEKERAACWAVPESSLARYAFGPDTDHGISEHHRPRWLNSGTIMGPVHRMRQVFNETAVLITQEPAVNSDQHHFANVFADQSYQRSIAKLVMDRKLGYDVGKDQQWLLPSHHAATEEHEREFPSSTSSLDATNAGIGLDYKSALFQTGAFYDSYITWMRFNRTADMSAFNPYQAITMPSDLDKSSPMSSYMTSLPSLSHMGSQAAASIQTLSWKTLPLAVNTITGVIVPIFHFTGQKAYRELWWRRNWFHPFAREFLDYRRAQQQGDGPTSQTQSASLGAVFGARRFVHGTTTSEWVPWKQICGEHEEKLLGGDQHLA